MSPRVANRRTLQNACLTGALGAAAITLLAAGPADAVARAGAPVPARAVASTASGARTDGYAYLRNMHDVPQVKAVNVAMAKKTAPTADDVVKLAVSQVGITENAAGGTKFNQWFMSTPYARLGAQKWGGTVADYANANWCDMFISWVGDRAGVKGMGDDAFTPTHAKWFQQQGRWGSVPKPGAVVFFTWSGNKSIDGIDHVGLVIKDNHDGTIQTVEGNTDDAVKIRTRSTDEVVGYGYPQYPQ